MKDKLKRQKAKGKREVLAFVFSFCLFPFSFASAQATVTVRDTIYNADGSKAAGTVTITWRNFTSADGKTIAGGKIARTIADGALEVALVPNIGAVPSGTSYTAVYQLANGVSYTEYWVIPAAGPVSVSTVRTTAAPQPIVSVGQQQITLGGGMGVLLEFWDQASNPQATREGQCYWNTAAAELRCSNPALNFVVPPGAPVGAAGGGLAGSYPNPAIAPGSANQVMKTNAGGSAREWATLAAGSAGNDFAISHAPGSVTLNLPDASATARGVVGTGAQTLAGNKTLTGQTVLNNAANAVGSGATINQTSLIDLAPTLETLNVRASFGSLIAQNAAGAYVGVTANPTANQGDWYFGLQSEVLTPAANSFTFDKITAVYGNATRAGMGTHTAVVGGEFYAQNSAASGTLANSRALYAQVGQYGAGTTTNGAGLYVDTPGLTAGTLTNAYGLFIADQSLGTNKWAIKTGLGKVELSDTVTTKVLNAVRVADQFPGANGGAQIQAAVNDASSDYTVYVPKGTYDVSTYITITGKARMNLICDPGATLRAIAGIGAGNPILRINGASSDVLIRGCRFDTNNQSGEVIQVSGTSTRTWIDAVEIDGLAGQTGTWKPAIELLNGDAKVTNSYIHDVDQACVYAQGPPATIEIRGNRCANVTEVSSGFTVSHQAMARVVGNKISGVSVATSNAIYGIGNDAVEWSGNEIRSGARGMHCDICNATVIEGNLIQDMNSWGIFAETGSDVTLAHNEIRNTGLVTGTTALAIGGSGAPSLMKTQTNALDVTTGLTAAANVTLAVDSADKQEGAASVEATIAAGFTTGLVFYQDFGSAATSLSVPPYHNMLNPFRDIWVFSSVAIGSGVLSLVTDSSLNCGSPDTKVLFPYIPATQWVRLSLYFPRWFFESGGNGNFPGLRCWGINAESDPGAVVINFDDFAATRRVVGNTVTANRVYWPNGPCYDFGNMIGGEIRGNYCEDPEYQSGGNKRAYNFAYAGRDYNSVYVSAPIVAGNEVRFTQKTGTTGQFWVLDGNSTVTDIGNRGMNVDTYAAITAGGNLHRITPDPANDTWIFDGSPNSYIQVKSTAGGTPTVYMQAGNPSTFGTLTNHDIRFSPNQTEQARFNATTGDFTINQNLRLKSGTSFVLTLDGAPTADRTVTIPDFAGTLAMLERAQVFTAAQTIDNQLGLRLRELDANGDDYIEHRAMAAITTSSTYTWDVPAAGFLRSTSGGVLSWVAASGVGACGANTFATALSDNAVPTCTQPGFANLSGSATLAQLPAGAANQLIKTNASATSQEHATLSVGTSGTDFAVAFGAGTITLNLPDASAAARGAVTAGAQTLAGNKTLTGQTVLNNAANAVGSGATINQTSLIDAAPTLETLNVRASFGSLIAQNAAGAYVGVTANPTANQGDWYFGLQSEVLTPAANSFTFDKITAVYGNATRAGTGTHTAVVGGEFYAQNSAASGTLANSRALYAQVGQYGAGTTTNAAGLYVDTPGLTAGTLTNAYGIFIANQSVGTNKWAIKTGTGIVELGDIVQPASTGIDLGTTSLRWDLFAAAMDVNGAATFTGTVVATGASATRPIKTGTALPGTCTANSDLFIDTDAAPAGQQLYLCNSSGNGWNLVGDGGAGGSNHNLLSSTHTDTLAGTVVRGDVIIGNSTPAWARLAVGAANRVLASDGTDPSWTALAKTHLPSAVAYEDETNVFTLVQKLDLGATQSQALLLDMAQPGAAGTRDSHWIELTGTSFDTAGHDADWRIFVDVKANNADSELVFQTRKDAGAFTSRMRITDVGALVVEGGDISTDRDISWQSSDSQSGVLRHTNTVTRNYDFPDASGNVVLDSAMQTLTNKTMDAEGTGNTVTAPIKMWIPAAACNNATAASNWDLPTSNPAVAACRTGTNIQRGTLDFADGSSLTAQQTLRLPNDWASGTDIDARAVWISSTTTGDVVWQVAIACASDADSDDPAFTDDAFTADTAKGTANQLNDAGPNTITTTGTCTAGDLMAVRIRRDSAHASDTMAGTARLVGVELTLRRAM